MRAALLLAMLVCVALPGCATPPSSADPRHHPVFDHYDPVALNESAVASVRKGDITTAWILLERAARLAPHDQRIARNLAVLRAFRAGTLPESASPGEKILSPGSDGMAGEPIPDPPALWISK